MNSEFEELLSLFNDHEVKYLIVGRITKTHPVYFAP